MRRSFKVIFLLLLVVVFIFPTSLYPAKRGIVVKARLPNGKVKPLKLYSGYYALVIGCGDYRYWPKLPNPVKDVGVTQREKLRLRAELERKREVLTLGYTITIPSINYKMVYIPPGEFMMGSPEGEKGRFLDERLHKVRITRGFYMGVTEVTVGQWRKFVEDTGYKTQAEREGGAWVWTGRGLEKKEGY